MNVDQDAQPTLLELDDETLLQLIGSRNESALSHLYERYARLLYAIALRITKDQHAAEEVLQDVFHAVWNRTASFRPTAGSVSTWLSAIARNRSIDEVRGRLNRARDRELSFDHLPDVHLHGWSAAVERGLEHFAVLRADLARSLSLLPLLQRQAIELAYFGGFSSSEIAVVLGEPIGTIKGRLRLGMDKLRQTMHAWIESDDSPDSGAP